MTGRLAGKVEVLIEAYEASPYHRGQVFIAASDELFVFDQGFNIVDSYRNQYLSQCHEIHRDGDTLWLTSTGFDAVLAFDLTAGRFSTGLHVDRSYSGRLVRKLNLLPRYSVVKFDPSGTDGPPSRDRLHINNVWADQGRVTVSGTGCRHILDVDSRSDPADRSGSLRHPQRAALRDRLPTQLHARERDRVLERSWAGS